MKLKFNADWHSYWLDGSRCLGATSVAGYPDNRSALEKWMKRMVLAGGARDPKLMERVAVYIDDKSRLNELAEQALELAKANEARDTGSAVHRITELIDTGGDLVETELAKRVRQAWIEAIEEAGCIIEPDYVERIVVYPDLHIAGTFDRLVRHWKTGQLMVLDLKTGSRAVEYPHPIAIQLAIYANAPLLAGPLSRDGTTTEFAPMPATDKDTGLIVHMPAEGKVEVVEIDIAKGWKAFNKVCLPIIEWRNTTGLAHQTISAATWAPHPQLVAVDGTVEPPTATAVAPVPSTNFSGSTARLNWVIARCHKIVDAGHGPTLMGYWPEGVPIFKNGGPRTDKELLLIANACNKTERDHQMPLPPADPDLPTPTKASIQAARSNRHEPVS